MFFILYWLGVKVSKHKLSSCIISVIVTSFFFGLLHSNYNYDQWLNITLIIGVGALVYFYFLFKYQTIVPLMIAHGLQDFLVSLNYNYDQWLNITLIIGVGALVYFYFLFKYQTIVPLMIAHGLQDFLVSLEHTEELTGIYSLFLVGLILIWFIARFGFGIKVKTER